LHNAQQDLEEYEKEIYTLDSRRSFLAQQRDRLREIMLQAQALLSPIRTVPDEILRLIFDDCCETNHFEFNSTTRVEPPSARDIPAFAVSNVCSRWRRIGLAFPNIWSRISVEY
ncbi:hypothetical protein BT96DRAFT_772927, partial [Gymnopus androsaceus JB14]